MTDITAKVKVCGIHSHGEGEYTSIRVMMDPDYEDGRNSEWALATPGINIGMNLRPEIAARFNQGDKVTVTFHVDEEPVVTGVTEAGRLAAETGEKPVGTTMGVPHETRPKMRDVPWGPDDFPYPPTHPKGQHGIENNS